LVIFIIDMDLLILLMILSVFVQDDQCADNARHPPAKGKQEHNEH